MVDTRTRSAWKNRAVAVLVLPVLCLMSLCALPPARAAASLERVVLQFNGPLCSAQHASIVSALLPLPGVGAVDLSTVPGHALIDIDSQLLTAQHVLETVRRARPNQEACRVEAMQSCITAGPLRHVHGPAEPMAAPAGH